MNDVEAVYAAMKKDFVLGMSLDRAVGGTDPRAVGELTAGILRSFGLLQASTRVLDLGCGCGRVAATLAGVLDPGTRYVGTDIIPGMVSFCRREISSRWSNFEFYCVDDPNPCYDEMVAEGKGLAGLGLDDTSSLDGQFDLVIASSVFTHLDEAQARAMLKRVRAWLAPGGSAMLTFFLLNHWSRERIRKGQSDLFAGLKANKVQELNVGGNSAVAFDEALLEDMVLAAGFPGIYSLNHGTWAHAPGAHLQDFIILKRDIPLPEGFDGGRYLQLHPDVAAAGMDPSTHWREHGKQEQRAWK
jgi:SAM-dependent methyltransferase